MTADQHDQEHDADLDRQMNKFVWEETARQLAAEARTGHMSVEGTLIQNGGYPLFQTEGGQLIPLDVNPLKTRLAWDQLDHDQVAEWLPRLGITIPPGADMAELHQEAHQRAALVEPLANLVDAYSAIIAQIQTVYFEGHEFNEETISRIIRAGTLSVLSEFLANGDIACEPELYSATDCGGDTVYVGHLKNVPDGRRFMTTAEYESFMEQDHGHGDANLDRQMMTIMNGPEPNLTQMTNRELIEYGKQLWDWAGDLDEPPSDKDADEHERRGEALLAEERRRGLQVPEAHDDDVLARDVRLMGRPVDAQGAEFDGEYALSPEAASVFWYLHAKGVWEPGHNWFGHADIRLTSDQSIQRATSLDAESVRRGLAELEGKGFIRRKPRFWKNGMRSNDAVELTVPTDWCANCHTRGEHECKPHEGDRFPEL